jgi:hypothetical protein
VKSVKDIKKAIEELEAQQKWQREALKNQLGLTIASFEPKNLINKTLRNAVISPVILLLGIRVIKTYGHKLIDRMFSRTRK